MNIHHIASANGATRTILNGKASGLGFERGAVKVSSELPFRAAPHNLDAEQALLGAILINNEVHNHVSGFLHAHHFFDPLHQQIYETAAKLISGGKQATAVTLRTYFENSAPLEPCLTVPQYLGKLVANATSTMNAKDYAAVIVDLASRRATILRGEDLIEAAHDMSVPLETSLRTSEADIGLIRGETSAKYAPVLFRRMSDIQAEPIEWLWRSRIACGKIGILAGEPGVGKSQITCSMAATVTTGGVWPDGSTAPIGSVIVICCEDDAADTLKPRLEAAGADCSKVLLYDWTANEEGARQHFDVGQHVDELSALVRRIGDVRLIIIDPISAYMGRTDSHVVAEVRQALSPIQAMAAELGPAVLMVSHLNKGGNGGNNAISRVSGSGAFVAVSRSAMLVLKDPEDESGRRRIMTPLKNNLGDDRTGFSYRVESWQSGDIATSRVVFDSEPVTAAADELLQRASGSADDGSALSEAIEFLRGELNSGSKSSKEIEASAREAGINATTLKRARGKLGVKARKDGHSGRWYLELPNRRGQGGQGGQEDQESHG